MDQYHYKHKEFLMTEHEHHFFKSLRKIIGDGYYIFPQIHLGTITKPRVKWSYKWRLWRLAFFVSDKYSVDYVVCDASWIKPVLVIELDDASHLREARRGRDAFVERMLHEARLPLVRFTNDEALNTQLVENMIRPYL